MKYMKLISLYSCESNEMRTRFDNIFGLHYTISRNSILSLAGSIGTQQAFRLIRRLFADGITPDMINEKGNEIQNIFKPPHSAASIQMGDTTFVDSGQLPEVGNSSDQSQLPEVGNSPYQNQLLEIGSPSHQNQLLEIGNTSHQNQLPEVGNSSHYPSSSVLIYLVMLSFLFFAPCCLFLSLLLPM